MNYFPTKPGNQLILDMINDRFGTSYTVGQLTLGTPTATASEGRNTEVTVGVATGPLVNQITKALYNRLNLSILFENYDKSIVEGAGLTNISDVLPLIQQNYNILIQASDIVDAPLPTSGTYPRSFTIQAAANSYSFVGNVAFNLLQGVVAPQGWTVQRTDDADISDLTSIDPNIDGIGTYSRIDAIGPEDEEVAIAFRYLTPGEGYQGVIATDLGSGPVFYPTIDPATYWGFDFAIYVNNPGSTSYDLVNRYQPVIEFTNDQNGLVRTIKLDVVGNEFRWTDDQDNVLLFDSENVLDIWNSRVGNALGYVRALWLEEESTGPDVVLNTLGLGGVTDYQLYATIRLVDRVTQTVEFEETLNASVTINAGGGEGGGPNAWTVFKVDNSIFGNTTDTGAGGDLYMTPNGETVDGDAFSRIETHDQRSVPAPFGRYVTGVRFSTTPVPETPVQATSSGDSTPSVYNLTLAAVDTPWAIDITVNNDFNFTQADPFNGTLNGFEYGIVINPDGLGLFPMRAVMVDNAGTKTIEIRRADTNALVKVADHVMLGGVGTPQEGNVVGFQVRFPHELLLSWFPAVEKTSADVPYGFWNCRIEFFATGQWDLPPFTIPYFDTQANITAP